MTSCLINGTSIQNSVVAILISDAYFGSLLFDFVSSKAKITKLNILKMSDYLPAINPRPVPSIIPLAKSPSPPLSLSLIITVF